VLLLLGNLSKDNKTLVEKLENAWSAETAESFQMIDPVAGFYKRSHYTIAPEVMLLAQREARNRQLDIIGIYHPTQHLCDSI